MQTASILMRRSQNRAHTQGCIRPRQWTRCIQAGRVTAGIGQHLHKKHLQASNQTFIPWWGLVRYIVHSGVRTQSWQEVSKSKVSKSRARAGAHDALEQRVQCCVVQALALKRSARRSRLDKHCHVLATWVYWAACCTARTSTENYAMYT